MYLHASLESILLFENNSVVKPNISFVVSSFFLLVEHPWSMRSQRIVGGCSKEWMLNLSPFCEAME